MIETRTSFSALRKMHKADYVHAPYQVMSSPEIVDIRHTWKTLRFQSCSIMHVLQLGKYVSGKLTEAYSMSVNCRIPRRIWHEQLACPIACYVLTDALSLSLSHWVSNSQTRKQDKEWRHQSKAARWKLPDPSHACTNKTGSNIREGRATILLAWVLFQLPAEAAPEGCPGRLPGKGPLIDDRKDIEEDMADKRKGYTCIGTLFCL